MSVTIFDITWRRAIIELHLSGDCDEPLYLYRVKEKRFLPFEMVDNGSSRVACFNVTIAGGRKVLSRGEWIVCHKIDEALLIDTDALLEEKPYLRARIERDIRRSHPEVRRMRELPESLIRDEGASYIAANPYDTHGIEYVSKIMTDLDAFSRLFRYGAKHYAYAVSLIAKENAEKKLFVALDVQFFMSNKTPEIRKGSKRFKQKQILRFCYSVINRFTRRTGNRILFFKENGNRPTENMEALQKRLHERGLDVRFTIAYRYRNVFVKKQKVLPWLKDMLEIAKSDYIFVDDYTPIFNFIDLDDDVVLTQIWHAGVGFKSVGYARFGLKGSPDPYASGHRSYTYALIGNEHLRDIYSEVFGIEPNALLATGMPRLDHFLEEETAQRCKADLFKRYPQLNSGRVILFAPTFRGTGQRTAYYPYDLLDFDALYDMCVATDSYFIFEMHHFIKKSPKINPLYTDRILDLSHESINELFHIADVLITDYSSCFYDYLLLEKPVILFVPDKVAYGAIRGVQRPIDEMAPGEVCETFGSLISTLRTKHYETVKPKVLTIDRASERGALASDRAIDTILLGREVPGVRIG